MLKFERGPRRGWRRSKIWRPLRWVLTIAVLLLLTWGIRHFGIADGEWQEMRQQFPVCGSGERGSGCVIDGDTLAIGQRRIRLTGYDAPEMDGACEAERRLARVAQAELSDWLGAGAFELTADADTAYDQYGRELRGARRDGRSLADHMIAQGLGRENRFQFASDWGDQEWC